MKINFELVNGKTVSIDAKVHDKLPETTIRRIKKSLGGKLPTYDRVIVYSHYIYNQFNQVTGTVSWCVDHAKSA